MSAELEAESEAFEQAASRLQQLVAELCEAIVACENAQLLREEIAKILAPLRRTPAIELRPLPPNAFEVVLAERIFDSMPDTQAVTLLQTAYRLLAPGGRFLFTMFDGDDPHYPLFNHLADAPLIARSEKELRRCFADAGISWQNVTLRREERELRIEVQKLE